MSIDENYLERISYSLERIAGALENLSCDNYPVDKLNDYIKDLQDDTYKISRSMDSIEEGIARISYKD